MTSQERVMNLFESANPVPERGSVAPPKDASSYLSTIQQESSTMTLTAIEPETSDNNNQKRPWILVAAAVAALALIGGLIYAGNIDDEQVPAEQPVQTVPAEPVDEVESAVSLPAEPVEESESAAPVPVEPVAEVEPAVSAPAEPAGEVGLPTSGTSTTECSTGVPRDDVERNRIELRQSCVLDDEYRGGPFADVGFGTISIMNGPGAEADLPANPFVRFGDDGGILAGTLVGPFGQADIRLVQVSSGANDYEGTTVHTSGWFLFGGDSGSEWYVDNGTHTNETSEVTELTADVTLVCDGVSVEDNDPATETYSQTCTYSGSDDRFVPQPDTQTMVTYEVDEDIETMDGYRYFTMITDSGIVRAGIIDQLGVIRFAGTQNGTGELVGTLVHELAWGQFNAEGGLTAEVQMYTVPTVPA